METDYFVSQEYINYKARRSLANNFFLTKTHRPEVNPMISLRKLVDPQLYLPNSPPPEQSDTTELLKPNKLSQISKAKYTFLIDTEDRPNSGMAPSSAMGRILHEPSKELEEGVVRHPTLALVNQENAKHVRVLSKYNSNDDKDKDVKNKNDSKVFLTATNIQGRKVFSMSANNSIDESANTSGIKISELNKFLNTQDLPQDTHHPSSNLIRGLHKKSKTLIDGGMRPTDRMCFQKVYQTSYNYSNTIQNKINQKYKSNQRIVNPNSTKLGFQQLSPNQSNTSNFSFRDNNKEIDNDCILSPQITKAPTSAQQKQKPKNQRIFLKKTAPISRKPATAAASTRESRSSSRFTKNRNFLRQKIGPKMNYVDLGKEEEIQTYGLPNNNYYANDISIYGFKHMSINELLQHEKGLLNLYENNKLGKRFHNKNSNDYRLSQDQYNSIFDKDDNSFYERKAFVELFRKKWKEDKGYCSIFDKRKHYKQASYDIQNQNNNANLKNVEVKFLPNQMNRRPLSPFHNQANSFTNDEVSLIQGSKMQIIKAPAKVMLEQHKLNMKIKKMRDKARIELQEHLSSNGHTQNKSHYIPSRPSFLKNKYLAKKNSQSKDLSPDSSIIIQSSHKIEGSDGSTPFTILIAKKAGINQLRPEQSGSPVNKFSPRGSPYVSRQKNLAEKKRNFLNKDLTTPGSPYTTEKSSMLQSPRVKQAVVSEKASTKAFNSYPIKERDQRDVPLQNKDNEDQSKENSLDPNSTGPIQEEINQILDSNLQEEEDEKKELTQNTHDSTMFMISNNELEKLQNML